MRDILLFIVRPCHRALHLSHAYVWHFSFLCVACMTRSHVWNDSLHRHCQHSSLSSCIYVRWPIHVCDLTHSYVWHESSKNVTWLIQKCDISHSIGRPCHRALHLPLRRLARHHGLKLSKVSSSWISWKRALQITFKKFWHARCYGWVCPCFLGNMYVHMDMFVYIVYIYVCMSAQG